MRPDQTNRNEIEREVEELEDAYAEAFVDNVDVRSLANVWDRIKTLRRHIEGRGNEVGGRSSSRQKF